MNAILVFQNKDISVQLDELDELDRVNQIPVQKTLHCDG